MEKVSCNIIKDILPLYLDKVVSRDTEIMVEEHLQSCEECKSEAEMMKKDFVLPINQSIQLKAVKNMKKLKKYLHNRRLIISVISVIAAIAVMVGIICLMSLPKLYLAYDDTKIFVNDADGNVYADYIGDDDISVFGINPYTVEVNGKEKNIVVFYYCTTLWDKCFASVFKNKNNISRSGFKFELGETSDIDEVYYGKFNGVEIYKELPSALEDMDMVWSK